MFLFFLNHSAHASPKNKLCPKPNDVIGVEAFMLVTSGIKYGHDKKCGSNFKYFDPSEIDLSDSSEFKIISANNVKAKISKISESGVVFYEIQFNDESNKIQTMTITILPKIITDDKTSENDPCALILSAFPDNLVRKTCI